jgi:hypothetical protein
MFADTVDLRFGHDRAKEAQPKPQVSPIYDDQALAAFQLNGSSSARRLMGLEVVPGQIETVKTAPGQKQRFHVSWILSVSHSKTKIVTRHQVPSMPWS